MGNPTGDFWRCDEDRREINDRKTLSDRRHLVNPSDNAKDELSVRCEEERSESVFFGFISLRPHFRKNPPASGIAHNAASCVKLGSVRR